MPPARRKVASPRIRQVRTRSKPAAPVVTTADEPIKTKKEYEILRPAVILHGGPRGGWVYYLDHMIQEREHGKEIGRPCPYRQTAGEDVHPVTNTILHVWVYDPDPTQP